MPQLPYYATNIGHMFYIRFATLEERTRYIKKLKKQDILAVFHYISLHSSPYYSLKHDGRVLPNTDQFTDTLLRLPMYYELSENEIDTIVNCFKIGKIHEIKWGDEKRREVPSIDNNITNEIVSGDEDRTSVPPAVPPPLTIVTGYLNIKIKRPAKSNTENQTYDYIDKSRGTLQIPQFMVIYCSEDIIEYVSKIRDEYGLLDKTKIIKIILENDLYMIDKLEKIRENVSKNNPPYNIPEYILAVNSRYGYIQNAIENNYFQTDYFAWIDFSASHIVNIPPNKIIEPKSHDKVRIGWIARYTDNQFVYNHHCLGGGIFSGHKEIMIELIKLHHSEFVRLTEMGHNINDDKLLFIIMEQYPYLFDTYYSDYKNLFIRS